MRRGTCSSLHGMVQPEVVDNPYLGCIPPCPIVAICILGQIQSPPLKKNLALCHALMPQNQGGGRGWVVVVMGQAGSTTHGTVRLSAPLSV